MSDLTVPQQHKHWWECSCADIYVAMEIMDAPIRLFDAVLITVSGFLIPPPYFMSKTTRHR